MTRWLFGSILLAVLAFAGSFYIYYFQYDRLPDQVPIHWNAHGRPDGFKPKEDVFRVFLMVPAMMAGFVGLTLLLPWLSPKHFEVDRFRDTFQYIMMLIQGLFAFIHLMVLLGSLKRDEPVDMGRWIIAAVFVLFALMGNVLGQVRRNFWMGVRTPWTLASETVWNRTHRVAAWIFVAGGLAGFLAVVAGAPTLWCFIFCMILLVAVPVLYSLVLYKRLEKQGKL
jgi:uncharacterized membrane protein